MAKNGMPQRKHVCGVNTNATIPIASIHTGRSMVGTHIIQALGTFLIMAVTVGCHRFATGQFFIKVLLITNYATLLRAPAKSHIVASQRRMVSQDFVLGVPRMSE